MKQITDIQIAAVLEQAKDYAKSYLKHGKTYRESGIKICEYMVVHYRNKLGAVCRALETLGLVDDEGKAYLSFLDEAERELSEEREKQS